MKTVKFFSEVNNSKCRGDKLCELVCPTGAIKVIDKKAVADKEKCVACNKCWDVCPEQAIRMVPRLKAIALGSDEKEVDQSRLEKLCAEAQLVPDQPICLCTGTKAKEVAAAILNGAKSLSEIPLRSGAFSGCGIYCLSPILRLFRAHGLEIPPAKGHQWYDINVSLRNIPEEIKEKYPDYYLKEDLELLESRRHLKEEGRD